MVAKSFDTIIIGSGPAGLLASLLASKKRKVLLVEKGEKDFALGKRILVSGNGRANFFNGNLFDEKNYDSPLLAPVKDIVFSDGKNYAEEFLHYLTDELAFPYRKEGELFYPYFNRSECLQNVLLQELKKNKVEVLKRTLTKIDPERKQITLEDDKQQEIYSYADLVLAIGGRSFDRENYDTSLLSNFTSYPFQPCLCPVKVKEEIPSYLNKNRLKGRLELSSNEKMIYEEEGELLFKKDGISGIAVFNSTLFLLNEQRKNHKAKFTYRFTYLEKGIPCSFSSYPYFLRRYLQEKKENERGVMNFTFDSLYPFSQSQISYGGIILSEIDKRTMESKKYPHLYLIGEMLDQNFICGGYNMGLSFIEGYKVGKRLSYGI